MNNRFIYIVVENNVNRFINKCMMYEIDLHDLKYIDGWVKTFCIFPINKYAWGICGV